MTSVFHDACVLLGSNIDPEENTRSAILRLQDYAQVYAISTTWETKAIGSPGPDFLNTALLCTTSLSAGEFKETILCGIEKQMGRIRTSDKNAPRTIDLDIIIFDGELLEPGLWDRLFVALTVSELLPGYVKPDSNETLKEVASKLRKTGWAKPHPELRFNL
jgi:2-amino-4-hydroxy-6-hydroxymethyldihydropteridine diphosphokinase